MIKESLPSAVEFIKYSPLLVPAIVRIIDLAKDVSFKTTERNLRFKNALRKKRNGQTEIILPTGASMEVENKPQNTLLKIKDWRGRDTGGRVRRPGATVKDLNSGDFTELQPEDGKNKLFVPGIGLIIYENR